MFLRIPIEKATKNSMPRRVNHRPAGSCGCLALFLILNSIRPLFSADAAAARQIINPFGLNENTLQLLEQNKQKQIQAARAWKAFHDFRFSDRYEESGIRFEHHPVDDGAKNYMAVHYDHGTALAGVGLEDKICVAASFADMDNDGLADLFVTTVRMGNFLFKNLGQGRFKDITPESGLGLRPARHYSGAVFFDFDNDGLLVLFVANVGVYTRNENGRGGFYLGRSDAFLGWQFPARSEQSILYQNLGGGKFKDVSAELGLEHRGWSGDATFCDLNEDGYPDLYVLSMSGEDRYYENSSQRGADGKRFVERTAAYFPKTPWGSMGVKFFDFNLDS